MQHHRALRGRRLRLIAGRVAEVAVAVDFLEVVVAVAGTDRSLFVFATILNAACAVQSASKATLGSVNSSCTIC